MIMLDEHDIMYIKKKNIHFGNSFDEMIEYYNNMHLINENEFFDMDRILFLKEEEEKGIVLEDLLDSVDMEDIEEKKELQEDVSTLAEKGSEEEKAIAEMIIMSAIGEEGSIDSFQKFDDKCIDLLLKILDSEVYYSPLSPGQGRAPIAAVKALIQLEDPIALKMLFRIFFRVNIETETVFMEYFRHFAKESVNMVLSVLKRRGWQNDKEKAVAIAGSLPFDKCISDECFRLLITKDECPEDPGYQSYLAILANGDCDFPQHRENEIRKIDHLHAQVKSLLIE